MSRTHSFVKEGRETCSANTAGTKEARQRDVSGKITMKGQGVRTTLHLSSRQGNIDPRRVRRSLKVGSARSTAKGTFREKGLVARETRTTEPLKAATGVSGGTLTTS